MAKTQIEIDEDELTATRGLVQVMSKMTGNPQARRLLQQARKLVDPDVAIPELDAAESTSKIVDEVRSELTKWREEQTARDRKAVEDAEKSRFATNWNASKDALRQEGYFDETIAEIEQLAEKRGIPDLEAAAALYRKLNPPSEVSSPYSGQNLSLFEIKPDEKSFMVAMMASQGEDEGSLRTEVNTALAEFRGQRRAA